MEDNLKGRLTVRVKTVTTAESRVWLFALDQLFDSLNTDMATKGNDHPTRVWPKGLNMIVEKRTEQCSVSMRK